MSEPFLRDPTVISPEQAIEGQPEGADQLGPGDGPETLILVHSEALRDLVAEALEAEKAPWTVGPAEMFIADEYGGAGICWPGIGGAAAGFVLERCIAAGTRRVFSLGFAAAIAPNAESGEVCLVESVVPHDGVTSHYAGPGYRPSPDQGLTRTLRSGLEWGRQGTVASTSAPYRQTVDGVNRLRDEEVMAVDMETGPVLAIAAYRGVPAGALLVTTDVIEDDRWVPCEAGAADDAVATAVRGLVAVLKGLRNLSS